MTDKPPRAVASVRGQARPINPHRTRGLIMLVSCLVGAAVWAGVLALLGTYGVVDYPRVYKILGLPFAAATVMALIGLAQLVFGRTLGELARAWDDIAGWQRLIVGLLVVGVALTIIITMVGVAITLLM